MHDLRMPSSSRVGCAGWSIPRLNAEQFPSEGSHLARYAQRFNAVEINSSFYRPHREATYRRWAATVPEGFQFAVKVPKAITHAARLARVDEPLAAFLAQASGLGATLGPLLVQLPPSLAFDADVAKAFFRTLRGLFPGNVVCEPRHATWLSPEAEAVFQQERVARVAADPAPVPGFAEPGGWDGLVYYRLHGSPRIYYSAYPAEYLARIAAALRAARDRGATTWCIFDNTAAGAATSDAITVMERLR